MSLIEQLGGYKEEKETYKSVCHFRESKTIDMPQINVEFDVGVLRCELLEYRREHNIFEVGDLVIKTHPKNTILWPVLGVYKNGGVWLDYKGFCWKPTRVRHATIEEIAAGKRLN